ncbi:MAG: phage major capsid protein [Ruminococcus flavefaciens]|nr:phage major capsid protein [Ruminococcus flavefaciens]MCM1061896.1 phage major capsid protein [Eubacterium sp.]
MNREQYFKRREDLLAQAQSCLDSGDMEGYNNAVKDIKTLDASFEDHAKEQANLNAIAGNAHAVPDAFKNIGNSCDEYASANEMYNSVEYRTALMYNFVSGTPIPSKFRNTSQQTKTSDVAAVVPTIWVQKIIQKLDNYGEFLKMVTRTNYKGGVNIPTSDIELISTWCAERGTTDDQKATTSSISFSYHKLRCVVAVSFEADTVTLDIFESAVIEAIVRSMNKAIEKAIFLGEGATNHQPEGFLTVTPPAGQALEIAGGKHFTYADLVAAEAALPEEYESGAVWTMPKKTFFNEIIGLTDTNGQPISRIDSGIDGKPEYTILGRPVKFNKYMPAFPAASAEDTIVAAIFDFSKYGINTNYQITLKSYIDEDTDDRKTKALMLVDGKVFDKNSLVTVTAKKKTA